MSLAEIQVWRSYIKKNGPMNDMRRFDRPAAILASIISNIYGNNTKVKDFMPFGKVEREATIEDFSKAFGGLKIGKRG